MLLTQIFLAPEQTWISDRPRNDLWISQMSSRKVNKHPIPAQAFKFGRAVSSDAMDKMFDR